MKKFVLLIVAALSYSAVYAGAFKWGAMRITDNGSAMTGVTALSYVVAAGTDMTATWQALASGQTPSSIDGFGSAYEIVTNGNVPLQTLADIGSQGRYTPNTSYDVYLVVIDENRFAYTDPRTITTPAWIETNEQDVNAQFGVVKLTDDDWHLIAQIPEPTALALLALGVAGAVLRRRN